MKRSRHPVALITGASRGLGAYLAREVAQLGYAVALHHRSGAIATRRLARDIQLHGLPALIFSSTTPEPIAPPLFFALVPRTGLPE